MLAAEIRQRFLDYFARNGHAVRPSSSLVPVDDPTLLFTNAGMVQFKRIFLGAEAPSFGARRATTSQKCVRAGGKHNDLEQVGHTARHNTFFEMLGNFSFGDYFKRDAIRFAWEFATKELGLDPAHLRVSVHHSDAEARGLWREIAGLSDSRIYGLGDKDNFWQMADTGPCGPCSEIFVDMAHVAADWRFPPGASGEWTELDRTEFSLDAFIEGSEGDRFLEFWNLVFMQFDRQSDGTLVPLPKPSVDTGAGLERMSAISQGATMIYHTDLFAPLLARIEAVIGLPYVREGAAGERKGLPPTYDPASYRVLADHGRAVAFLLADGVFPSNDGRGYVLRRILRRAVRHAWLLGRKEPTLVYVVETVIETMGGVYPELSQRSKHLVDTTRLEEQSFLATIEGGMSRFEQLAPEHSTQGGAGIRGTISGDDAFRLYDTYGFPIDLTELMARERGYTVDISGFEAALGGQRKRSQQERKAKQITVDSTVPIAWIKNPTLDNSSTFVGYDTTDVVTDVIAITTLEGAMVGIRLKESPFYAESGGQVSDIGEIAGTGWHVDVEDVRKSPDGSFAVGKLIGEQPSGRARATVFAERRRNIERNHTATHLLHAALRRLLGDQVQQAGSLVTAERLRFDFTHHGPVPPERIDDVEAMVNRDILTATPVSVTEMAYPDARARGAMALFGEKYGEIVRVVDVAGVSTELCGGTHVPNTAMIGLFTIVHETGVAAGIRRIEAVTGIGAYESAHQSQKALHQIAEVLKVPTANVVPRVQALLDERRLLEKRVEEAQRGGGDQLQALLRSTKAIGDNGAVLVSGIVRAADGKELQALGDAIREKLGSGVGVVGATFADGKNALIVVVTDDLRERGIRADTLIREIAAAAGGRGGGKAHMAQAGIPDAARFEDAFSSAPAVIVEAFRAA